MLYLLETGRIVSINGIRHQVLANEPGEKVKLLNCITLKERNWSGAEILSLYSSGLLRILGTTEAFDSNPALAVAWAPDEIAALPPKEQTSIYRKVEYVRALEAVQQGEGWEERVQEALITVSAKLGDTRLPSLSSIYRWRARLSDWGGEARGLASYHQRKGNSVSRLTEETEALITSQIKALYLKPNAATKKRIAESVSAEIIRQNLSRSSEGLPLLSPVSYRTVCQRISKLPKYDVVKAQFGQLAAERLMRSGGSGVFTTYPLERCEIDHTQLDICLVTEGTRLPIGRPHLTAMIDVYSRCLLGFHLSFKPPNQYSILQCIKMAVLPKSFLKTSELFREVKGDWVTFGLPTVIAHDAGKDFLGSSYRTACFDAGIQLSQQPVLRPWLKGHIERLFGTITSSVLKGVPGKTMKIDDPGKTDNRYHSVRSAELTFNEFQSVLVGWIVDVYHQSIHSSTLEAPIDRWNNGIINAPPRLPHDSRLFTIWFALRKKATITARGIVYLGLNFCSNELLELRDALGKDRKIAFKYSEDDMSKIYVFSEKHRRYLDVPCKQLGLTQGLSWSQYKEIRSHAQKRARSVEQVRNADILEAKEGYLRSVIETARRETIAARRQRAIRARVESQIEAAEFSAAEVLSQLDETLTEAIVEAPRLLMPTEIAEPKSPNAVSLNDEEKAEILRRRKTRGSA
jgi:putative transposase